MRYIALLSFFVLSTAPAYAGFEWIPPKESGIKLGEQITNQKSDQALTPNWQEDIQSRQTNRATKSIESMPLADNNEPTSLFPPSPAERLEQQRISAMPKQNLSGKKLFINPYPLRTGQMLPPMQGSSTSIALQEAARKLNPVRLGSGFSTGTKPKSIPFPKPSENNSVTGNYKPRMPAVNKGLTPMDTEAIPQPFKQPMKMAKAPPRVKLNPKPMQQRSMASSQQNNAQYVQAIGFGQDLPLELALSQIIPSAFTHSFSKNIDTDMFVSWEGGKAWNLVLNDMLRSHKLTAIIQGNKVTIQPMASL